MLTILGFFAFAEDERKPKHRMFEVTRSTGQVHIDGKLDEPAWKKARPVTGFHLIRRSGLSPLRPAATQAQVLVLWDDNNIYFGAEIEDEDLFAKYTAHDSPLYKEDVFEVFVWPDESRRYYYEFEVNPLGTVFDMFTPNSDAGGFHRWGEFKAGIKAKGTVKGTLNNWRDKDKGWTLEFAIPLTAFKDTLRIPPKPGDKWRIAFCKYDYSVHLAKGREMSSTCAFTKRSFHNLEDYDAIVFR